MDTYPSQQALDDALYDAVDAGDIDAVCRCLEQGARMTQADEKDVETLLHAAIRSGEPEIVRCLVDHGEPIDITDEEGTLPIDHAADEGAREIMEILLDVPVAQPKPYLAHRLLEHPPGAPVPTRHWYPHSVIVELFYATLAQSYITLGWCDKLASLCREFPSLVSSSREARQLWQCATTRGGSISIVELTHTLIDWDADEALRQDGAHILVHSAQLAAVSPERREQLRECSLRWFPGVYPEASSSEGLAPRGDDEPETWRQRLRRLLNKKGP